jgi:hypothetical protein
VDLGEFVKFLPAVLDGTLPVIRLVFYLPPLAVAVSVALLIGSRCLSYSWCIRVLALAGAGLLSVQLLPPAWSPASLATQEFRFQAACLGLCWLLLAGFWLWRMVPLRLTALVTALSGLQAAGLCLWQYLLVRPAVDEVYQTTCAIGWGLPVCLLGLFLVFGAGAILVVRGERQ